MTLQDNTKADETKEETTSASDFGQWSLFAWRLIRSLAVIVAGTTVIYLVCRWLIY